MQPLSCLDIYNTLYNAYGRQHWWPADTQDEVIIGAVLTQNTSWTNVERAIANLKQANVCTLEKIKHLDLHTLAELIKPSGYFNVKARRLHNVCTELNHDILINADIPTARASLLAINGVGKETADSILLYAFDRPIFVIDAYTKRLFSRLGVTLSSSSPTPCQRGGVGGGKPTDDYDAYQEYFMNNLPQDTQLYNEYHALIVRHAKYFCKTKPVCEGCCLSCSGDVPITKRGRK